MELFRLDGQIAVVTGGSGLYGLLIARAMGEAGARVVIASRSIEDCRAAADRLSREGLQACAKQLDLESEASIHEFTNEVVEEFGRIDTLVNNSVSRVGLADLKETTRDGWEEAQRVNGSGLMLITKAVVTQMCKQRSGSIINIASIQGVVGPHFPVYGDTGMTSGIEYTYAKWGMIGFTKWLANYYARFQIRANCISPGGYNPGLLQDESKAQFVSNYRKLTPMGRFAEEDDIKGPAVFLASNASRYVTGQNLIVDGGWTNW
ncbi:SDR family oxidoreductase [Paenibacillus sp. LMG 31456]|uniref:SDR family oxidoreductase n=2 Tax=Paenibacillus foliorum TaxID=2654974 RepID=A0A972H4H3_9BACL|nr:SDR family oxidoreductase [Paenibacillus foliorum]